MTDERPIDRLAAEQLLRDLATAIFQSGHISTALNLMTADLRREWANDWVVGELEMGGDRLEWSERSEVTDALASMDTDHGLWDTFAAETLATWREMWAMVPGAIEVRGSETLSFRWHRSFEELQRAGGTWAAFAPERKGPVRIWVDLEEHEGALLIADVNAIA